ncbi:MAG TPA: sugar ABC transporter substrate-binding protein [Firmicutes bacterium]|nr:sugar ABC transporter substrate-binding protein [Bacillota bacterium]
MTSKVGARNVKLVLAVAVVAIVVWFGSTAPGQAAIELRWAFWGGADDMAINRQLAQAYEATHPGVKIVLLQESDYDTKVTTMIASNNPPDVMELAESFISYASKGLLADLTPFIQRDKFDIDDFYAGVVRAYSYDNKVMAIPVRWGPMIQYYNKDLFAEAGLREPDPETWTWDTFVAAGRKLTRLEGQKKQFAIASTGDWWPWWMTPIYQNGGAVLSEDRKRCLMGEQAAVDALEWYQGLTWKEHIAPQPADWAAFSGMGPDQLFENGRVAMNWTGFWAVYWLRLYKKVNWDVMFLPKGKVRATPLFSNGWAIPSSSPHKDQAWEFIKFLSSPEQQRVIARSGHDVPVRKSVAQSAAFLDPNLAPSRLQLVLASAAHLYAPPTTPYWGQMLGLMGQEISAMLRNELTARQAADRIVPAVNQLLSGGK